MIQKTKAYGLIFWEHLLFPLIMYPPWSPVVNYFLGNFTGRGQVSVCIDCVRWALLCYGIRMLYEERDRVSRNFPYAKRFLWVQMIGMAIALPVFVRSVFR